MKKIALPLAMFATLAVPTLLAGPANALVPVAYVDSAAGSDVNTATNCQRTAPCQTVTATMTVVSSPGTIIVVADSVFAPVTITTGLTISCPGVSCIFNSSGGATGITVSAGTNTVGLNGVSISGFGSGGVGLSVTEVGKIELKNTSVSGNSIGINFAPSAGGQLYLLDSEVRYSSTQNVLVAPTGATLAGAVFTGSRIHHGNNGIKADVTGGSGGASVMVQNSVISFHNNNGISAIANGGARVNVFLDRVDISHSSGNGVQAYGSNSFVILNNSAISFTAQAFTPVSGGVTQSYGNNAVRNNTAIGTITVTFGLL
jgi:hypothetical protein